MPRRQKAYDPDNYTYNLKGSGKNGIVLKEDVMNLMGLKPQPSERKIVHGPEERIKMIKHDLSSLEPLKIDIEDEGHLHVGHAGAKSGGHFKLYIVSKFFDNMSVINRHKLIYKTLDKLMKTEIHALSITAKSPNEL